MENKNDVKGNGKKLGELPGTTLNVLLNFLDVKDVSQLSGANKWLHETIIGNTSNQQSGNCYAKERIEIAKIRFDEKIYTVLDKVARSESQKLLDNYKRTENKAVDYFVINQLGNLSDRYTHVFVTVIESQLMFFDIWSTYKNLSGQNKFSTSGLQAFFDRDEIKARKKILFGKQYTIDNLSRCDWCDVFVDFVRIYFQKIKEDLGRNINFGSDIKAKITSEFIKFWLWQLSQLDAEIKRQENEFGYMKECGGAYSDCRDIVEMMESSLFNPNNDFSITFEKFIDNLNIKELQEFLFDNKYNFATRFRDRILDNINLIFKRILKSKNYIDKQEPIDSKLKKLLCNLMTKPKLIDKLKIILPKKTKAELSDLKITIGDGAEANQESLETLKLKLKLLDDNYRKNRCLYRMSNIVSYLDEYYDDCRVNETDIDSTDYDIDYDNKTKFYITGCDEQKKRIFLDFAEYFCASNVDFQEIKDNIYKLRIDHLNYLYNDNFVKQIVSRSQYTWERLKTSSYTKFEEDITKIKIDLDIKHNVNENDGNEIQNVEEQVVNTYKNDEIKDKSVELDSSKNSRHRPNVELINDSSPNNSMQESKNNSVNEIQNVEEQIVNTFENAKTDGTFTIGVENRSVEQERINEANQNIVNNEQVENLSEFENMKTTTDNSPGIKLNKNENVVNDGDSAAPTVNTAESDLEWDKFKLKTKNIINARAAELSNQLNRNQQNQTIQKHSLWQLLKCIFAWLGNKIKSGFMSIKNFVVSLIFRNTCKGDLNKTLDKKQNSGKNIGNNNSKETKMPKVAAETLTKKRNKTLE